MKIGIDAKWYFKGPASGKVVIENLVNKLAEANTDHEFVFFLDEKERQNTFPYQKPNIKLANIWAGNNLVSNLFVLPKVAKEHNIDVLVYQNFPSLFTNYKQIAYIHDIIFLTHPEYYTWKERLYFSPLKFLAKHSDRINTVSYAEQKRISDHYGISETKIDVIHHGVNTNFKPLTKQLAETILSVKSKYKLPDEFLLYVGRLNVRKNIFNLLSAIPKLENQNIPLVIVGGFDWKMGEVESTIDRLGIRNRLIFTGPVFGKELAAVYSLAKVFCFPSYEESFGLPPLEAMASGIPVVVSDSSSIPEICGDAGNYVDAHSPESIANMIDKLLTDPELYEQKRQLSLKQAAKFSWEKAARDLIRSCEKAVGINAPAESH